MLNSLRIQDVLPRLMNPLFVAFLLLLACGPFQHTAFARTTNSGEPVTILVQYNQAADKDEKRPLSHAALDGLQKQSTLSNRRDIQRLTYANHDTAMQALVSLRQDPDIRIAELNQPRELHWEPTDEELYEYQARWIQQVEYPDAWNITTGSEETIVAVLDSGVSETHPDLVDKLVPGHVTVDDGGTIQDIDGHGTHVAGIIAANGSNGIGTAGTAMDVRIMPVRVLEEGNGRIAVDAIVDGIYWAVDNGADLLNLSLGADSASQLEREAIQYATSQGVPVIASSGNKSGQISYPASYPETISVGAVDAAGNRAPFSSVVSEVDLAAPGTNLYSPHWSPEDGDTWSDNLNDRSVSGTSFAAAVVSGAVALMKSINPELESETIRGILTATATESADGGPQAGLGAGMLHAEDAVRSVAFGAMYDTWYPADFPVANGQVQRTWLWGTDPPHEYAYEPYAEAQHGVRLVHYYDKSRMELNDPLADRDEEWYVTNGLLVTELVTGELQVGDDSFEERDPAHVNVAGDASDPDGPTYATFSNLMNAPPIEVGQTVDETVTRAGQVSQDDSYADYEVNGAHLESTTQHTVADVFWDYLNSTGPIASADTLIEGQLFDPWFYATGLPITEAYWSEVQVAGTDLDVLMQCFERRCLTYTPDNPEGWQVEMGNVGLHYYAWRYGGASEEPDPVEPPPEDETDDEDPGEPDEIPSPPETGETIHTADLESWSNITYAEGTTFYAGSGFHIRVTEPPTFIYHVDPDAQVEDAEVTTSILPVDAEGGEACLATRIQDNFTANYAFCVTGEGKIFAAFQEETENGLQQTPLFELDDPIDLEAFASDGVRLSVLHAGENIWFKVNDELAGYATHDGPPAGGAGVFVFNHEADRVEYIYRDFSVSTIIVD